MRVSIFAKFVGATVAIASVSCGGAEPGEAAPDVTEERAAICLPCLFGPTTIVSGVTPTSIALSSTDAYFTNGPYLSQLDRVPLGGGPATVLAKVTGTMNSVTRYGNTVYWADYEASDSSGPWSISTSGTAAPVHLSHHDNDKVSTQGVAVYTTSSGLFTTTHVLFADALVAKLWDTRLSILGASDVSLLPDTGMNSNFYPFSIVIDGSSVYFTHDTDEGLYKAPIGGGSVTQLVATTVARSALALAGGTLYFQQGTDLKSMSTSGGAIGTFAAGVGTISAMVANGGVIYWTCPGCGTVSKQAVSGGGVTTLASNQSSPNCLAVDATYVYFGTSNALKRIAK
jgi:hypothetical protein